MSTSLNDAKRAALVVGGVSAVVCASAAYYWVKNKNKNPNNNRNPNYRTPNQLSSSVYDNTTSSTVSEISDQEEENNNLSESSSASVEIIHQQKKILNLKKNTNNMIPVTRGGRRNYRALKKCQDSSSSSVNNNNFPVKLGSSPMMISDPNRIQTEAEVNAARLAAEFSTKVNFSNQSSTVGRLCPTEELNTNLMINGSHSPSPKGQGAESPSLASDGRSEVL